jgi:hypothetical protein
MLTPQQKAELLLHLRDEIAACERPGDLHDPTGVVTGFPALDGLLPPGGLPRGSLVELLDERSGCGAETLAVLLARAACRHRGAAVVVDRERQFHPPAVAAWGLALDAVVVVHAANEAEELWAADQALRSRAVGAVWLRRERLHPHDFRRLRLAAEEGGTVGVLLRPARARGQPTWADVQWAVGPQRTEVRGQRSEVRGQRSEVRGQRSGVRGHSDAGNRFFLSSVLCPLSSDLWSSRRLRVEVMRCRGGAAGRVVEVELDDVGGAVREVGRRETLRMSAPAPLAGPAAGRRTPGVAGPPAAVAPAGRPPW